MDVPVVFLLGIKKIVEEEATRIRPRVFPLLWSPDGEDYKKNFPLITAVVFYLLIFSKKLTL